MLTELATLVPSIAHIAGISGIHDNFHHFHEVSIDFVAVLVEFVALRTDRFGEGHQFFDSLVAVIPLVVLDAKVAEIRQCAAIVQVDFFDDGRRPSAVGRQSAVILHNHIDVMIHAEFGQAPQSIRCPITLFIVAAQGIHIDANGRTAEVVGGGYPFEVVGDGFLATPLIGVSQCASPSTTINELLTFRSAQRVFRSEK